MNSVGLIGGTGDLGTALAVHLAKKYEMVTIGSRNAKRAEATVKTIIEEKGTRDSLVQHLKFASNADAILTSSVVIATIPFENSVETIQNLSRFFHRGQILISAVASLSKVGDEFIIPTNSNSIAIQVKSIVPQGVEVASAFQTVPASILYKEKQILADVPVAAESFETYKKVAELVSSIDGLRPLFLGGLHHSAQVEGLTCLLLNIGKRNNLKSPTLRINCF
jgi:NADPH-dependent F420 reductase